MADITYIQATGETKIVGQDSTGNQVNQVAADATGHMLVAASLYDGAGTAITSTLVNAKQRLDVTLSSAGTSGTTAPFGINVDGGIYNSTPPTLTTGQSNAFQLTSMGKLITASINSYKNISGIATTVVKSGAGILHSIVIGTTATGIATLYDNTAGSGTVIGIITTAAGAVALSMTYDINFNTGLTIVTNAPLFNITVSYS
jgi:hypothetical protein